MQGADDDAQNNLLEEAQNLFLDSRAENVFAEIAVGGIGAFATEDPVEDRYYLVQWTEPPTILVEDVVLGEFPLPLA